MSEYIIRTTNMPEHVREALSAWYEINEEIVRCRDCKRCMAYAKATYCDLFAHRLPNNEIDGFCAWGERREP